MAYEVQFLNVSESPWDKVVREVDEKFKSDLSKIFSDLAARQEPLGAEFARVWNENIEELYES